MIAIACKCENTKKNGKNASGNARLKCKDCGRSWVVDRVKPIGESRISVDKAILCLNLVLEGMSIRAASRVTGVHKNTIGDLILRVGSNCDRLHQTLVQDVPVADIQADEIWSFVGAKNRTCKLRGLSPEMGDSWTWIGIESGTKMVMAYHVAGRDKDSCREFLEKLDNATSGRFQLTTDGLGAYKNQVPFVFRNRVDFAQLVKVYGSTQEEKRYSPAKLQSCEKKVRFGNPDLDRVNTSFVERLNLSLRMHSRRHTRLTNAFSKDLLHHEAFQHLFFAFYNFCRKHETLKGKTPAMVAGVTQEVWTLKRLLTEAAK